MSNIKYMKSNEENGYQFTGMNKVRLPLSTYVCLCMLVYMSKYIYFRGQDGELYKKFNTWISGTHLC